MILPDVNVLVYAFRREAENHDAYASWLRDVVAGSDDLALHDIPLVGLVRITTNRRIMPTPAPVGLVLDFVQRLIDAPRARWLPSGAATWAELRQLAASDRRLSANLAPDAHLAALAIAHGCRIATADRGFARFPGVAWFDPVPA